MDSLAQGRTQVSCSPGKSTQLGISAVLFSPSCFTREWTSFLPLKCLPVTAHMLCGAEGSLEGAGSTSVSLVNAGPSANSAGCLSPERFCLDEL